MRRGAWALLLCVTTACLPDFHDLRGRWCDSDDDCAGLRCVANACRGGPGTPPITQPPNTWRPTPPMPDARAFAGAARLADGRVLVCGGRAGSTSLSSAVLYDPVTNTFTPTGSLNHPRAFHEARLLPTGDVLVVGGSRDGQTLTTAELYRTAEQRFETVTDAPFAIDEPLTGGTAPIFFGADDDRRAFRFETTSRTWSVLGASTSYHAASAAETLLDGRIAVLDSSSIEILDPSTGSWTNTGLDAKSWYNHEVARLEDGRILIAGGVLAGGTASGSAAQVFTAPSTLVDVAPMSEPREDFTATLLPDGRVLVVGGFKKTATGKVVHASAELFDPSTQQWSPATPLSTPRASHAAVLLEDGSLLIVGGYDDDDTPLETAERYFP